MVVALVSTLSDLGDLFTARRLDNLQRFVGEALPYPLTHPEQATESLGGWAHRLWTEKVWPGIWATFWVAVAASCLAGALGLIGIGGAARTLATSRPYVLGESRGKGSPFSKFLWAMVVGLSRGAQILGRALPEYILAFLLVGLLGLGYWPAILALAIHNGGILGRLGSEVVEDAAPSLPRTLRATGSTRGQILWLGLLPILLGRFLVYFFYRWETCVREATILGFVGVTSLGLFIRDSRARDLYDEMMVIVLAGALLVLFGDAVSSLVRRRLDGGGSRRC